MAFVKTEFPDATPCQLLKAWALHDAAAAIT